MTDIGGPPVAGEGSFDSGTSTFELIGSGYDIWGTGAQFTYLHQTLIGNGEIVARITSQENTDGWAKAGVMIKETTSELSPYAMMAVTPSNGYAFQYNFDGHVSGGSYTFPNAWVKLTRNNEMLKGYVSSDGQTWTEVGTYTVSMQTAVQVGMFVASHNVSEPCTVTFDNVAVESYYSLLPAGWQNTDIGNPYLSGRTVFDSSTSIWDVKGAGHDIWGTCDQLHYAYKPLNGDGYIVARIISQSNTNDWAKAGVIIKESTNALSNYAMMAVTPANSYAFQYNFSGHSGGGSYSFPNAWVKLERVGNTLTGYRSADGTNWTYVGSTTITMSTDITIGLFITSHYGSILGTVTMDHVAVFD